MSQKLILNIGWLYPNLMSTYGDRGNVICLQRRSQWRNILVNIIPLDQKVDASCFSKIDIVVGGGAQDRQQEIVMRDLKGAKAEMLKFKLDKGTPGVFTCASPQLLGHYYESASGQRINGLGLLDIVTKHSGSNISRCVGNMVFQITASPLAEEIKQMSGENPFVIGFENHGGRTYLGNVQSLGKIILGYGNNGEDGCEGVFYRHAIATYSHGPLLAKNSFITDWLIKTALKEKYQEDITLINIDDNLEKQARKTILKKLKLFSSI
ncbi:type 1 glutamine amidotransferase [Candidatus Atelocyanobacterium thalassae]|uniref:Lipid II isoglutaminyl synthase (glutamine-hydrolyzing) subunit GatD n=1 Tax=cyanobacterium endosymbiont of Braarudosphaera bigelowii TaxID=1285375 RepID=A0ABN6K543_9CHRO|nr:type 1 glutamine amidotransferase [Candidatus Atelocyanobacterium thalassa]BDA40331.1 hypothetical protein CPARK_000116900 [cyanobacterium endosymbiont of Braarudosphaera bigelowii]